jgi:Cu/Ag efflux pump CusA
LLVLMVFLADWRTALISSVAIPVSLLAAGLLLHYRGGTLDTMVLAGLVIALGEVVDAIIDVENIIRRLRPNRVAEHPQSAIVFGGTRAGYEIEHPLAVVILDGLMTSTLLNLFIVPALYLRYGRSALLAVEDKIPLTDGFSRL